MPRDYPRLPGDMHVAFQRFFSLRCAGILTEASRLVLTQLLLKRYRRGALEYSAPRRHPPPTLVPSLCYHTTHGTATHIGFDTLEVWYT